ncbi:MAG: TonB-dependent receptor [Bacteroidetes bacterium]|nr:TonB-dependent receptor [Bacteroidota bacterium]
MHFVYKSMFCSLLICSGFFASAQTSLPDSSQSIPKIESATKRLEPVEVRALRAGSESPFAKTDISGQELQEGNLGQDLPFLLQYTPSVVVTSDAGAGVGYTGIRIRGSDATRINITLNGVPVNDAESQGAFFVDLPDLASSIGSLQIQRGIGSSTNGAGAFGASMNISSLEIPDQAQAEAALSYGSFNTQKYTFQAGTGLLKDRFALQLRLSQISSEGYVDRSGSLLQSLQLNGLWKLSSRSRIRAMVMQGVETTHQAWNGVPEAKLRGNDSALKAFYQENLGSLFFNKADSLNLFTADPRRYNSFLYGNQIDHYRQNYYQLFAEHDFSSAITGQLGLFLTRGIGYYEEYKANRKYSDYGLSPYIPAVGDTLSRTDLIRQLWLDNYNYGLTASLLWKLSARTNLRLGGAASQYQGRHYGYVLWAAQGGIPDHYRWYALDAQKNDFNLYLKAEQRLNKKWLLTAELQERSIGYFMNGFRDNPMLRPAVTYHFFNPKLGLSYQLPHTPLMHQRLYLSIAHASHEPNRDDFEASPTALPKPESLWDAEGGYEIETDIWSAGLNAYYMRYTDQLVLTGKLNDVGAYTRTNVPNSFRAGLELQAQVHAAKGLSLQGNINLSRNQIDQFDEYLDNYDDGSQTIIAHSHTDIAFSPNITAAGSLLWTPFQHSAEGRAFQVELLGNYVGRQFLDNTGNKARSLDPYGLLNLRLHFKPQGERLGRVGFSLALNNLLNKAYESNGYTYSYLSGGQLFTQNNYFPQAGFNWLLGMNWQW